MVTSSDHGVRAVRARMRELLARPGCVVAPGCHDALAARIAQDEGFEAVYLSGNAASAGLLGRPDVGLADRHEMTERARWVTSSLDLPVLADADAGYGDSHAVARTVREFEAAGVAGIHVEDQDLPKRCGAMEGVRIVPFEDAVARLRAALKARTDPDFLIIARTDALALGDEAEAVRRAEAFAEEGADLVMVEDVRSEDQVRRLPKLLPGVPLLFDAFEVWPWTLRDTAELGELGYKIAIMCLSTTLAYAQAARTVLRAIRDEGSTRGVLDTLMPLAEYERVLGIAEFESEAK
ncbi:MULTISPECIES: oxaloacetate decarboxylase [unclassified Amycolatopsis]|uniref:isocitrate lyase/PEP mutase family protein n=1 Tax=unclassified Amycolatopsis TaxID=2618356 RepID=UPI001C698C88|nr:oxaloacetate decarboxylase [Amycolatopsis sp. DSM 110486]QYN17010.1 oxaloacetate decarboxylase [Amycolatopsis sp. DSM 110486]